jgi:hypothetical protein
MIEILTASIFHINVEAGGSTNKEHRPEANEEANRSIRIIYGNSDPLHRQCVREVSEVGRIQTVESYSKPFSPDHTATTNRHRSAQIAVD